MICNGQHKCMIKPKHSTLQADKAGAAAASSSTKTPKFVNYAELGEELLRNVNLHPSDSRRTQNANALYQHPSTKGGFLSMITFNLFFTTTFVVCSKVFCGQCDVREFFT